MITVYNLNFVNDNPDAGLCFSFLCPKCHQEISVAEHAWWYAKCKCGKTWHLSINAYSDDLEDNDVEEKNNDQIQ